MGALVLAADLASVLCSEATPSSVAFGVLGLVGLVVTSFLEKTSFSGSGVELSFGDFTYLAIIHPSKNTMIAPIVAPMPMPAFA